MRRILSFCLICLFAFSLTACGPREHRVLATTAFGAVAGAGLTAAFDGDPLAGAVIGGSMGALGGYALSTPRHHAPRHGVCPPHRFHQ